MSAVIKKLPADMTATMTTDYITVVKASEPLGKRFSLSVSDEVIKESGGFASQYIAQTLYVQDLQSLRDTLNDIASDEALILGWMPGSEDGIPYTLLSEKRLIELLKLPDGDSRPYGWHDLNGKRCSGRFKENFHQSSYILFDRDIDEDLPEHLQAESDDAWWNQMAQICPELSGAARLVVPSSSNRVLLPDGTLAKPSPATHTFIRVQDASDVARFGKMLDARAWLNGFGYVRKGKNGQDLKRTIFDTSVFTPERLVFESAPVVGKGLKVGKPAPWLIEGEVMDTAALPDLADADNARHTQITGRTLRKGNKSFSLIFESKDLDWDMSIETQRYGIITVRDYYYRKLGKVRCQTPFRESDSWAAFLNINKNGLPFLFDTGSGEKHLLKVSSVGTGFEGIEPIDIFAEADRPMPVWTADHYPSVIARYAEDIGLRTGADPAIPCWTALLIAAAAIPDWIKIQVKANDQNWTEAARLWVMVAGMPSIKKSPPMTEVRQIVDLLQAQWSADFKKAIARYELDFDVYKEQRRKYIKNPDANSIPVPPQEVHMRRLLFTDSTIEGVARLLEDNPQGLLAFHDELAGWFGSMDAYRGNGINKDRPDWLKLFNGGPHLVDRASGHRSIPNWSASILGGIQPAPLKKIARNLDDDGLLQRFLVILANAANPDRDVKARPEYANAYMDMVRDFTSLTVPLTHRLTPAAQQLLNDARHEVQSWGTLPIFDSRLQTAFQKGEGILARLVLLFHYLEGKYRHGADIAPETVSTAVSLYKAYLAPSLIYFYGQMLHLTEGSDDARWIAGYILSRGLQTIDARGIRRAYKNLRNSDSGEVSRVMDDLFMAGWVEVVDPKIGRPPHRWAVNPLVHERFKARAEAERMQRERVRQQIQEGIAQ